MAARDKLIRYNPFDCRDADLPLQSTLIAKLSTFAVLLSGRTVFYPPHLPFIHALDLVHDQWWFAVVLSALFTAAVVFLFLTRYARPSCLVIGLVFLVSVLASKNGFANHKVFYGCVMLLLGLDGPHGTLDLLRWQLVIVYAGAGLNKMFLEDWWNGQFFFAWANQELQVPVFTMADTWFGNARLLSRVAGWAVIGGELAVALMFAVPRFWRGGVWFALCLQVAIVFLVWGGGQFAYFNLLAVIALLAFVQPPISSVREQDQEGGWSALQAAVLRAPPIWFAVVAAFSFSEGTARVLLVGILLLAVVPPWPSLLFPLDARGAARRS